MTVTRSHYQFSTPRPILDSEGRIFAALAGRPEDPTYLKACEEASELMLAARDKNMFERDELHHKRGDFPAVNVGIIHGNGTKQPTNLRTGRHAEMLKGLLENRSVQRLAGFADGEAKPFCKA